MSQVLIISPDSYDQRLKNWGYAVTDLARNDVGEEVTIRARGSRRISVNFNLPTGIPEIETFFLMLLNVTSPKVEAAKRPKLAIVGEGSYRRQDYSIRERRSN